MQTRKLDVHSVDKNSQALKSLTEFCDKHPELRFWQALVSWSGYNYIYGSMIAVEDNNLRDTFYKE